MEHMNQENHSQEASVETQQTPKFSVGIDLGTTHCVMSLLIHTTKTLALK